MFLHHIVILAIIQGVTEFLPISSTGHLILTHGMFGVGEAADNRLFDIALHIGTLIAVLICFRQDVFSMIRGFFSFLTTRKLNGESRLLSCVLIASLPVIAAGLALHSTNSYWLFSPIIVAIANLIFAIPLWWADKFKPSEKTVEEMGFKDAFIIGCIQILALIPGVSRSGITMTAGRWLTYERLQAARFSLLLSMVANSGAGFLGSMDLISENKFDMSSELLWGVLISGITAWVTIVFMMRFLSKFSFAAFAGYRIVLGIVLLALIAGGYIQAWVEIPPFIARES